MHEIKPHERLIRSVSLLAGWSKGTAGAWASGSQQQGQGGQVAGESQLTSQPNLAEA